MAESTLEKIKLDRGIMHSKRDASIQEDIDACLADLRSVGIKFADETDPLILNAIKLWCRSLYADDAAKGAEWLNRYNAMKSHLMMAEGYAWEDSDE